MLKKLLAILCIGFSVFGAEKETGQKKLKFFNLDLHVSVIADIKHIFEAEGHQIENWSLSDHTWVFKKQKNVTDIVTAKTWQNLDQEMCNQFYERYKDHLSQFDAFIVTHNSSFALLYEKFNKPILIVNSTRYENPFSLQPAKWAWLNQYLKTGVKNNKIFIVSNNKGDAAYLKYHTGIESEIIPSLCLYTHAKYTGKKKGFYWRYPNQGFKTFIKKQLKATGHQRLMQNKNLPHHFEWQQLYDYQGVVHFPYQISTMSIFEQYSANVPLFFPSKKFLLELRSNHPQILSQLSFIPAHLPPSQPDDPNNIGNPSILASWINAADFYDPENMPYVQYFDSFDHLKQLLTTANCKKISGQMKAFNEKRTKLALEKWGNILQKVISSCDESTAEKMTPP